jgi:ribonuclease HI
VRNTSSCLAIIIIIIIIRNGCHLKRTFLKINTDVSYAPGEVQAGLRAAVQDHNDELFAASAGRDAGATAYTAELQAMMRAVEIAVDLGPIRVVFESDSQLFALALNRRGLDFSQMAARLDDLKIQLRTWVLMQQGASV